MKRRSSRSHTPLPVWSLCKGALLAAVLVLLGMGLWTLLLLWQVVPLSTISVVNSVLKFSGAGASALLSWRACVERPALYGGLAGVLFYLLSFCSMSLFARGWSLSPAVLGDMGVTLAVGMATGAAMSLLGEGKMQKKRA